MVGVDIVSSGDLAAEHAGRYAGVTVIDARTKPEFLAGHIPGAAWMGWEDWCMPAPDHAGPILRQRGYWGVLASVGSAEYAARLSSLGIRDDGPIVVYAGGPRSRGREGRIAWMLLYLGAREVFLLDGGWSMWVAAGGVVEAGEVRPEAGCMNLSPRPERRRTLAELRAAYHSGTLPLLVDTRSPAEFAGEIQAYLPRRGHLPGAQLLPFTNLFRPDSRYVTREDYLSHLPAAIRDAEHMVAYCEVGVRASLFALLHEIYTGTVVPVYDGSLMEWSLQRDLPMGTTGQEPQVRRERPTGHLLA